MIQDTATKPVNPSISQDVPGALPSQVSQVEAIRTHVWANLENFTGPSTGFNAVYLKLFPDGIFLEMDNRRYRLPFESDLTAEFKELKKLEPVYDEGYPFFDLHDGCKGCKKNKQCQV
ncbi:MAG: hypothetical protein LLG04_17800 [Parachlamydia sp.]|nr:hypothetical protein [Parachlamydia sp.]